MSRASIWRAWSLVITAAIVAAIGILAVAAVRAQSDSTHPTNLTGEIESDGVVLQWHAPNTDAGSVTGYEILRRRPLQGETVLQILVADTESRDTTYTDTSATTPGEGYVTARRYAVERFSTTSPSIVVTGASIRSLYGHTEAGLENAWIFFLDPDGDTDVQFRLLPNRVKAWR